MLSRFCGSSTISFEMRSRASDEMWRQRSSGLKLKRPLTTWRDARARWGLRGARALWGLRGARALWGLRGARVPGALLRLVGGGKAGKGR